MRFQRVLIIDSGAGGLSVTQSILRLNPNLQIYYIADTRFFPYGALDEEAITERVEFLIHRIQPAFVADVIVIACNTASTVVLNHLRERFCTPFVGVVPAVKPAASISTTKHFAVLATQGTIRRPYTHNLIDQFARDCQVELIACPNLVDLAEKKLRGCLPATPHRDSLVRSAVNMSSEPETVVLACTHFPLLKDELRSAYPGVANWIDSGEAIARRVHFLLKSIPSSTSPRLPTNILWNTSSFDSGYQKDTVKQFLGDFEEQS